MKDPKRVLIDEATRLISDPTKWHTQCCFKDKKGNMISLSDLETVECVSFCAYGAMLKLSIDNGIPLKMSDEVLDDFYTKYGLSVGQVNDKEGREAVISKLKGLYDE